MEIVSYGRSYAVKPWNILVTGSSGLIGSEAVEYFDRQGHKVVGADNNMRRVFFGPPGDTLWNLERLKSATRQFTPVALDIRDRDGVMALFRENRFDLIIHCAAQPSHDKAAEIALLDFEVNALGTVNLLEATRQHCRDAAFIFMSTNKVYGDAPNEKPMRETETRYDYSDPADFEGIDENCRIDRTLHSLFGASKVAADIYAQEYGRYFGMARGNFSRRMPDRPVPFGRRAARVSFVFAQGGAVREAVHGIRLQGKAGSRQHPQF